MADEESRAELDKRGVKPLSPADALAGLAELIAVLLPSRARLKVLWPGSTGPASFRCISKRADGHSWPSWSARCPARHRRPRHPGRPSWSSGSPTRRCSSARNSCRTILRDAVADVTRVDPSEIREDAGFFDLGMDSLMAVELRRRIEQGVGKEIPATLAMDYPRLSDVVDYLLGDVLALSEQASKSGAAWRSGDDAHGRADRDHRGVLPLPRRARPGSVLGCVVRRCRRDPGSSRRTASTSTSFTTRTRTFGQDLHPLRRIPRRHRRIRSGVLRHLSARGRLDRAPAAADARNGLGRSGTGRLFAGVVARQPNRRLRRRGRQRYAHLLSAESIDKIEPTSSPVTR